MNETQLEQRVNDALAEDALLEAYDLLRQVHALIAERPAWITLRKAVEERLLSELQKRFHDRDVYPHRMRANLDLRSYHLTSHDVFVLGLFDGCTTLGDALALSPHAELETLRAVAKLTDPGLLDPVNKRC